MASNGITETTGNGEGVANGAKIAFFDMGDSKGNLYTPPMTQLFGKGWNAGARIHSASWGTPKNVYSTTDSTIDSLMYVFRRLVDRYLCAIHHLSHTDRIANPELLIVIAAGNDGTGNVLNTVGSPAVCKSK